MQSPRPLDIIHSLTQDRRVKKFSPPGLLPAILCVLAPCVLIASLNAGSQPLPFGPDEAGPQWGWNNPNTGNEFFLIPNHFLKLDIAQLGLGTMGLRLRLLKTEYIFGRLRAGISLADVWVAGIDSDDLFGVVAPVHLGINILAEPVEMGFLWSRKLDVYVQAEAAWAELGDKKLGRLRMVQTELCIEGDHRGVGGGLYAGLGAYPDHRFFSPRRDWTFKVYAGFDLRVLTFGIELWGGR